MKELENQKQERPQPTQKAPGTVQESKLGAHFDFRSQKEQEGSPRLWAYEE